ARSDTPAPGEAAVRPAKFPAGSRPRKTWSWPGGGDNRGVALDARNALGDAAQDLVADRARPAREVVDGDLLDPVATDQRHDAAEPGVGGRNVGDVNHHHVHADRAHDRHAPAAVQHGRVAHVAQITVGVAERKRRYAA